MMSEKPTQQNLKNFFQDLIKPHPTIQEIGARRQAQLLAAFSLVLICLLIIGISATIAMRTSTTQSYIALAVLSVVSIFSYLISRTRYFSIGSFLLTLFLALSGFWLVLNGSKPETALISTIPISLILGSVLLSLWGLLALSSAVILATFALTAIVPGIEQRTLFTIAGSFLSMGISILAATLYRNAVERQRLEEVKKVNRELQILRSSLEQQVEERTRQVRTAAEIAQSITSSLNLDDLLRNTVDLIIERFGYYHAGIFLVDELSQYAILRAAKGPAAEKMLASGHRLAIGSPSIIGWVTANKEPRLASNVAEDPIHLKNELLPETQAEIGVPIITGEQVLGVLDVQSINVNAFDPETIAMLRTLAGQIAIAIQNVRLIEAAQVNLQGISEIYQSSYQITKAKTDTDVFDAARRVFQHTPFVALLTIVENDILHLVTSTEPTPKGGQAELPEWLDISSHEILDYLTSGPLVGEVANLSSLPPTLLRLFRQMQLQSVAFLPVTRREKLATLLIVGTRNKEPLVLVSVQPYISVAELVTSALERIHAEQDVENRLKELEAITFTSQAISTAADLPTIYKMLHSNIQQHMGDVNFIVTLYEPTTESVNIPYRHELNAEVERTASMESLPLGEDLTSIVIHTKQPIMIVEDLEQKAVSLGAQIVGKAPKSWLGVPLIISGEIVGAIIVQDTEHEYAFDDGDLRFLTALSSQVAGAINNFRLLDETRKRAIQLQTAAEIARDISGSLDLNDLLAKAVSLIQERFNFYYSAIFLIEPTAEYAVIREATGEAGTQMKRAGHKFKIGSRSVIGFVTGNGEPLVVNDTTREPTEYADPLLSETRAEVGIPLKVGTRILGALDVHSKQPYAFSEEIVRVLRVLADQLAIAVINTELFAETQEHLSQHRLLHHVTTAAASGTTIEEALNSAAQGLQVTLGGDRVAILLASKEKRLLEVKSVAGYSEEVKQVVVPYGTGITGWVAVHQQSQRVDDVSKDPRYIRVASNVRSELAIPLVYRGELLGVLNVESDQVGAYSDNDEELLGTLGGSLAAIISNARLLDQIRRQVDRERLLYEVTSKIRRSTDIQTIMATTTSELSKALGARRAEMKINVGGERDKKKDSIQSGNKIK